MANAYEIKLTCSTCNGTGELTGEGGNTPCQACSGDGKLGEGTIGGADQIADLTDKVNDINNKVDDILEKLGP